MARAQLHHTGQVDERRVRGEWAWPTGGMHRHRDHGMGTPKSSAQRRSEWPCELHLRAPSFRKHLRHKGGTRERGSARKIVGEPMRDSWDVGGSWVGHSASGASSRIIPGVGFLWVRC